MKRGKAVVHMDPAELREELIARTAKFNEPYITRRDPSATPGAQWTIIYVNPLDATRELVRSGFKSKANADLWAERLARAWALGKLSKSE